MPSETDKFMILARQLCSQIETLRSKPGKSIVRLQAVVQNGTIKVTASVK